MSLTPDAFARLVDHTLLKPEASREQIQRVAREGLELGTASVCVNSLWVSEVEAILRGSDVKVCAVVGFPLGSMNVKGVQAETRAAVNDGADEIDMVMPVGLVKSSDYGAVADYVGAVRDAASGALLKVILETALLTDQEIADSCRICVSEGADFMKTSTGFNPAGGASTHAVRIMRGAVGSRAGVKASGGIRTLDDVQQMLDAGATRLGMSATADVYRYLSGRSATAASKTFDP